MQIRYFLILLVLILLSLLTSVPAVANVGSITNQSGQGEVVRGSVKLPAVPRLPIAMKDTVRTGNGRIQITFQDNSIVKITEQSRLVIDEFVYDPKNNSGKMNVRFAAGTARFIGGRMNRPNIKLNTPTATIGVRGTDFTTTVDETGKSMFILLPDENGHIGTITVSTNAGIVVLNKAFQSTTVATTDSAPTRPIILDISVSMIDNMVSVSPPNPVSGQIEDQQDKSVDSEMFNLSQDFLKDNSLTDDPLSSSEGDTLGGSLMADDSVTPRPASVKVVVPAPVVVTQTRVEPASLVQTVIVQNTPPITTQLTNEPVLNTLVSDEILLPTMDIPSIIGVDDNENSLTQESQESTITSTGEFTLQGTSIGYDSSTQINTVLSESNKIEFNRSTKNFVSIKTNVNNSINISIVDIIDTYNVILNDGTSVIKIIQKN